MASFSSFAFVINVETTFLIRVFSQSHTGQACADTNFCGDGYCCKFSAACFCSHENCHEHCQHGDIITNPPPASKLLLAAKGIDYSVPSFEEKNPLSQIEKYMLQKSATRLGMNGRKLPNSDIKTSHQVKTNSIRHQKLKESDKQQSETNLLPKPSENASKLDILLNEISSLNKKVNFLSKSLNQQHNQSDLDDSSDLPLRKRKLIKFALRKQAIHRSNNSQGMRRLKKIRHSSLSTKRISPIRILPHQYSFNTIMPNRNPILKKFYK